ncbi:glycosyltransferase family 4 protein [Desulfobacula sp.]|uniref:glycosyltransferase family 4 protein n=1 Tax=Desulfobacula sp. TaxID=2593537 RepID=UPI0026255B23|nr:glycosyltransferase family 4 protein [Desulfobacula sp.]
MKIAFYAPFKPLGHPHPSGDLMIARGIVDFLESQGHTLCIQSTLRARWIYLQPWRWGAWAKAFVCCLRNLQKDPADVWLTYHTYYKAPDLLGPWVCKLLGIKYVIFQGIYSTKRKRRLKTILGFYLNRAALRQADHVFTNKLSDLKNLKRIVPKDRLSYIKPGIHPRAFEREEPAGRRFRKKWGVNSPGPILLTAAMFRDDVKTKGLSWLIRCCAELVKIKLDFHLVIAGSGKRGKDLKALAEKHVPGQYTFVGKIDRKEMVQFYSSGDVFAFPGIRESLGMVYLEAQACGLPVVAFNNGGIPEVVVDKKTGFLVPPYDCKSFSHALVCLLTHDEIQNRMGENAVIYVKHHHDIDKNYAAFEHLLQGVVA